MITQVKYALAVAGIRFGWWLMKLGTRINGAGIDFTGWAETTGVKAGLDLPELIYRVEESVSEPNSVSVH